MTDEAIALLAPQDRHPGGVRGVRACRRPPGTGGTGSARRAARQPRSRTLSGSSRGRWPPPSGRRSWTCCTATGSLTWPRGEVWAILLDEGTYLGSVSTYYRVLREAGREPRAARAGHPPRRRQARAGIADGPNQVYSWDITKLHGPAKWTYYHLYVILDIFSRYAVGWMVATCESAALAEKLIAATCAKQGISRGQLSIHADRGSSMTSKPVALLSPTWRSPSPTPGRTSPTTTRTPRRSCRVAGRNLTCPPPQIRT